MIQGSQGGLLRDAERAFLSNNFARAEKYCRLQLQATPGDKPCRVLLALVLAKTNRSDEAVLLLEEVNREGGSYESYLTLSTIFFFQKRIDAAIEQAESAIQLEPHELSTYNKVGLELVQAGFPKEALAYFRRALEYSPNDLPSAQNYAAALKDAGLQQESQSAWKRVTELAPEFSTGWLNFGMLQLASHDFESALAAGQTAVRCDEKNVDALHLVALAYSELGRAKDAEPHLRKALTLEPNHPMVQASLALALQEQGQFGEARTYLEKSLERWETNGLAYYALVRSRKIGTEDTALLHRIESMLQTRKLGLLDRSYMEYSLGKAYEDLTEYENSILHFDSANEAAHEFWFSEKPWDPERYRFNFRRTIEIFSTDLIDSLGTAGLKSERPIFIVGMIRSGTTLVEQILSSHPDISGAGELTYWHEVAGRCFDIDTGIVQREALPEVANQYLQLLDETSKSTARVTDKLPHNYAMVGLIRSALPNARFIHIRRNPLDNCLSVYSTGYQRPPGFTLSRRNIVTAYRQYHQIMDHWRKTLPESNFLEIDYEELIANREIVTRQMIKFIGLPWNENCLHHERNERAVHTPSAWQVRQPLYRSSIDRWRNFEPWLREFEELSGLE